VAIDPNKPCKNGHGTDRLPNGNCHLCELEKFARYHNKNKGKESRYNREHKRLKRYGLTPEQYDDLFRIQNGRCKICGKPQSDFGRKLAIDHNHKTGRVRGLLCNNCNVIIGLCYENTDILISTISYLNEQ